jgi:hypothetical protein
MLAKDPGDRYQSADELLEELQQVPVDAPQGRATPDQAVRWTTPGMAALRTRRFEATKRLAALMATAPLRRPRWRYRVLAVVAGAVILLAGGVFAYRFATDVSLVQRDQLGQPELPAEPTALEQWLRAVKEDTPEAWQAVVQHYEDTKFATDAKRQLALCYLDQRNEAKALALFDEFAALGEKDEQLWAFGLAGRSVVLTLEGDFEQSAAALEQLRPIGASLHNPGMERLKAIFEEFVIDKNREVLGEEATQSWYELLREPPPREDEPSPGPEQKGPSAPPSPREGRAKD